MLAPTVPSSENGFAKIVGITKYSGFLTQTGYKSYSIDVAFNNVKHLSPETVIQNPKEKQLKATA